jgi:hypothetical protein
MTTLRSSTKSFVLRLGYGLLVLGLSITRSLGPLPSALAATMAEPSLSHQVIVREGKVTVQVHDVSLSEILSEIGRQSGAHLRWLVYPQAKTISATFTATSLAEALERLLGEHGFLLFYTSTGQESRLSQIWIASGGQGAPQFLSSLHSLSSAPALTSSPQVIRGTSDAQETSTVERLVQTATSDQDLSLRLDALAQLEDYAATDQRVADTLSVLTRNDPNPQVRDAAAEILQQLE